MKSRRLLATLALTAALTATAIAQVPVQPGPVKLSVYTPKDSLVYVSIPNFAEMVAGVRKSPFKQLWDDPEMQDFLHPTVTSMVQQGLDQMKQIIGHDIDELAHILGGSMEFNLRDVSMDGFMPKPLMTVAWTANDVDKAKALLARMLEMGAQEGAIVSEALDVGGVAFQQLEIDDVPFKLIVGFVGPTMILSSSKDLVTEIVGGNAIAADAQLHADADYQASALKAHAARAHIHFALGLQAIAETIKEATETPDEKFEQVMSGFGLDTLSWLAGSLRFDERGAHEAFHLRTGKRHGFMELMDVAKPGVTLHNALDGDSVAYIGFKANLVEAFDKLREQVPLFRQVVGEHDGDEMEEALDEANSGAWGFKLRDDLFAALGDEFSLSCRLPSGGGFIPDVLLIGTVKDPKKLHGLLDQLIEMAPKDDVSISKQTVKPMPKGEATDQPATEYPLYVIRLKSVRAPVSPAVALMGDKIVFGAFLRSVKNYVRRGIGKPLTQAESFRRGVASIGWQDTSRAISFMFLDVKKALAFGYETGTPFLSSMDPGDLPIPLDFAMLPTVDAMMKPFDTAVIGHELDELGISAYAQSPIPVSLFELAGVFGASAMPRRMHDVRFEEAESARAVAVEAAPPQKSGSLGITLEEGDSGCSIVTLKPGSAAGAAGLQVGDVIVAIDGKAGNIDALAAALADKRPGQTVVLRYKRGDATKEATVTLK